MHHLAHAVPPPFYDSGTFWAGAGFLAVVLGLVITVLVWRLGPPRPVIVYRMPRPTPLIAGRRLLRAAAGAIEVRFRQAVVNNPHVAELRVECRGRKDIASSDFDKGKPLVFDLGATVLAVVDADPGATSIALENLSIDAARCGSARA